MPGMLSCKGKNKTASDPAAASKNVLPNMKAASEQTYLRAAETGTTMALPQHTKEVVEKAAKLEEDIQSLEKIGGAEIQTIVERKKQELKALQPKLPSPHNI